MTDSTSMFYSSGLYYASASTTATATTGPCLYVAAYAAQQSQGYTQLSQTAVPTTASQAAAIEAQVPVAGGVGGSVVANEQYVFLVTQEVMYRYIASC
jgi:hypothetical protein